jgi:hypothetical protein
MPGSELLQRLAEHHLWNIPCRGGVDGQPTPRIFTFDKRVMFAFSDRPALDARPAFLRSDKPDEQQCLTIAGALMLEYLPQEVDVLVLDATDDPAAPGTINYPREMHARLRQRASEVALELAAADWSELNLPALRQHPYWILGSGSTVHNLLVKAAFGRPMLGLFSTEAALEAHLSHATPEEARTHAT